MHGQNLWSNLPYVLYFAQASKIIFSSLWQGEDEVDILRGHTWAGEQNREVPTLIKHPTKRMGNAEKVHMLNQIALLKAYTSPG